MRRLGIAVGLGAMALGALAPGAGAATITVDEFDDPVVGIDVGCSIRDAIESANDNADFPECNSTGTYGTAPDTILIPGGTTSELNRDSAPSENDNVRGDLDIESPMTITATGTGLATIDQLDTLFGAGMPDFEARDRVFHVESNAGAVTFNRLRITGGLAGNQGPVFGIPFLGGGGILAEGPLTITDSEIVDNISREYNVNFTATGGGIMVRGASARLTMTGSTVAGNTVTTADDFGAGSTLGGGIAATPVSNGQPVPLGVDITNSTISGNRAVGAAAGHFGTVAGLYAARGPSPGFDKVTVNLTNVTITDNQASAVTPANGVVGGIQLLNGTIRGSIVAANTDTDNATTFDDCGFGQPSGGGNLIGRPASTGACAYTGPNDLTGTSATPLNPNLGTLLPNGGLTRTHAPNPGSPAINRGGTCPATDQIGLFRYSAVPCDAGSVEIGATATPPASQGGSTTVQPPTPPAITAPKCPKGKKAKRVKGKVKCVKKKRKKK